MTPIRLVLDSTAITAYAATSIAVGEVIAEVAEENAQVALPLGCLVAAYRQAPEAQLPQIGLLVDHPSVVIVGTDPADWLAFAGLARDLGSDAAEALLLAVDSDGYVLTNKPDVYGDPDELPVIPI